MRFLEGYVELLLSLSGRPFIRHHCDNHVYSAGYQGRLVLKQGRIWAVLQVVLVFPGVFVPVLRGV